MMGSYACAHVTLIVVWIVSKNKSNCLLENKMMSIFIWRHFTRHRFNSAISETFQFTKKITLARLACLCLMLLPFQEILGKEHASKPEAR